MDFITVLGYILAPITAVVTYYASRKKRENDFLSNLQSSIDLLTTKNKDLYAEMIAMREENLHLRTEITAIRADNKRLREEVEELNRRLENVKTITRTITKDPH